MTVPFEHGDDAREATVERYLHLTRSVMPDMAKTDAVKWPVVNDHCFQRIVLDAVCGGTWYDHIARPAYRNMTAAQATAAVALCEDVIAGRADLRALNTQSLVFRGKLR